MYAIRKIFEQGQIFGLKFYFRPHRITRSDRCIETVLCKVWGSCPGVQKTTTLMFSPVSLYLTMSTTAVAPKSRVRSISSDPVVESSRAPVAVTYSCKPLTIIHHGTRKIILIIFFFNGAKKEPWITFYLLLQEVFLTFL